MALSVDQFGKAVVASGLMKSDELKTLWATVPAAERPKNGETFAKLLRDRNLLNEFQAEELLSGSNTPLVLGDYVLLAKIGAGGMGQVFKAEHKHMGRLAAIKLLPSALTKDEAAVKRFQREVKTAAKLSHPNIVQTYDAGVQHGVWYLVMEYVEGKDLSALLKKNGPLPIDKVINYMLQTARGLAFAHGEGVVHRDIKPANLLLDKKGVVKILDMGLARFDDFGEAADHQLTNAGQVMGTIDYMAPEQAASTHDADARSDIYSLGCSLYRLLTGENVYYGETVVKKLFAHLNDPIPFIRMKRAEVPAEIDRIFQKMLAKKPEHRYQQATQLVAELEAWRNPGVTLSFAGSAPAMEDSKLTDFHHSVDVPGDPKVTGNSLELKISKPTDLEQTAGYTSPEIATDPKSEIASDRLNNKMPAARCAGRKLLSAKLIAAGAAGFMLLLLGVIVIVRSKDGKEVARLEVADGNSVDVRPTPAGKPTKETPTSNKPVVLAVIPPPAAIPAAPDKINTYNDPAFQQWMKDVAAMPAEEQWKAVAKRLQELNPEFDGNVKGGYGKGMPTIENGVVKELTFYVDNVTDISPVRALLGLANLNCSGSYPRKGKLSDLSPLKGMSLANLRFGFTLVSDLSPLRGMPLTSLDFPGTKVSDLSPLQGMPLTHLNFMDTNVSSLSLLQGMKLNELDCQSTAVSDLTPVEGMPLSSLSFGNTDVSSLSPLKGMQLTSLNCAITQIKDLTPIHGMPLKSLHISYQPISDLSALKGMPLTYLACKGTLVTDLSPLEDCKSLKNLFVTNSKVTAEGVATLQKALPHCKIEWDDPAKGTQPQPAASGTK